MAHVEWMNGFLDEIRKLVNMEDSGITGLIIRAAVTRDGEQGYLTKAVGVHPARHEDGGTVWIIFKPDGTPVTEGEASLAGIVEGQPEAGEIDVATQRQLDRIFKGDKTHG